MKMNYEIEENFCRVFQTLSSKLCATKKSKSTNRNRTATRKYEFLRVSRWPSKVLSSIYARLTITRYGVAISSGIIFFTIECKLMVIDDRTEKIRTFHRLIVKVDGCIFVDVPIIIDYFVRLRAKDQRTSIFT